MNAVSEDTCVLASFNTADLTDIRMCLYFFFSKFYRGGENAV